LVGAIALASYPTSDESFDRLHRAGWSVGHVGPGPEHTKTKSPISLEETVRKNLQPCEVCKPPTK
jgi:hypothetical protein